MASVGTENSENSIKSTCYDCITCRNTNLIINIKRSKLKIMCGFITILFIAWAAMIGVFSVQDIQYIEQRDLTNNQSNTIKNHENTVNSLKKTIATLNDDMKNLNHELRHIKSYVNVSATNLVTHDTLNHTTKELHSNIQSFGEKVELVNSTGQVKINDSHYYLSNLIKNTANNLEIKVNKNITNLNKNFETRINKVETQHNILKSTHLRHKENTKTNFTDIKNNITNIKNDIVDIKNDINSYKIITNYTLENIQKAEKINSAKTNSINKIVNSLSRNVSNINENNKIIDYRVEQLERTINESKNSLKIYLNKCPEGWTLYTKMISLYVCYKN